MSSHAFTKVIRKKSKKKYIDDNESDIIEKEKRKEILNIMNSHYKVKSMLYKYGARQFAWPCFVYILLLVFCIYTVPSFFWESDYAFEVNSLIITELRKDLITLKDEDTGVFGAPRGFLNIGKLGPWISESMLKTHLPYLHENGKLQQIGNIKICSLLSIQFVRCALPDTPNSSAIINVNFSAD